MNIYIFFATQQNEQLPRRTAHRSNRRTDGINKFTVGTTWEPSQMEGKMNGRSGPAATIIHFCYKENIVCVAILYNF